MNLYLVDGNSFCYRAYYAIPKLTNSRGEPTNAVYGFVAMLNKLIKDKRPDLLAVCFDPPGPTFRHKKYQEYKIHRKPMPDDLYRQLPLIKRLVQAYCICSFEEAGFEADDVIATLAVQAAREGMEVYIVTGDKDILQLVNERIKVYSPHKDGLVYDAEKVREDYGVGPEGMVEIMALWGDASDNIPGVPGIGEKTAVNLIKKYGTLEGVLAHADEIGGRVAENLKGYQDQARLSRLLAELKTNLPLEVDWKKLSLGEPDKTGLISIYKELEFKSLLKDIKPAELKDKNYRLIRTNNEFIRFLGKLKRQKIFSFDLETTSPDCMQAEIVGISFCWQEEEAFYVPFPEEQSQDSQTKIGTNTVSDHFDENNMAGNALLPADEVLRQLKPILENEHIRKIGQNIKYELVILSRYGINLAGIYFDTMVGSYLLNPTKAGHNLDSIAIEYLGYKMTTYADLVGTGKKQLDIRQVPLEQLCRYSCEDAEITFRLKEVLEVKLREHNLTELYQEVEIPLIFVLGWMEEEGVAIDLKTCKELSVQFQSELDRLSRDIYEIAGEEFNINSPKQLQSILFEKLGLPVLKRTKTGASTDVEVLRELASQHALPMILLKYRELTKLKSGYLDALPKLINPGTGRVHTSYNQAVTATGRLSSSEPNLQNIPVRTEEGRKIRRAFIPRQEGWCLLSADYSQIELRILAHISGDETLIDAFSQDADIHCWTASLIFGVEQDKVTAQMRGTAKTVNFGIIYGMSPYGLSKELGIELAKAKDFIQTYFNRYPRVRDYLNEQINMAREQGFVTTLMSRRRYIDGINSQDNFTKQFAERTAINTPIQGSAADIIKVAMIEIHHEIKKRDMASVMILQVHDELVFDMPISEKEPLSQLVKEKMEGVIQLKVPIKVDIKVGDNWLEA